ncbi:MAG: DUF6428 family protein [Cyclobacteriaceae bacterium]
MRLSEVKKLLPSLSNLEFRLPDGSIVPKHFHVTEVGVVTKNFIDCGGTVRNEKAASFQLWQAQDHDHRLAPQKLLGIIELSEKVLNMEDLEIEVEYQADTIGKYGLDFEDEQFALTSKFTNCLAPDKCGIDKVKPKIRLSQLESVDGGCTPGSGCC